MLHQWCRRRGCERTVLIWWKSRKNPWKSGQNLRKPSQNPWKQDVSLNSSQEEKVCGCDGGHPGVTVWNLLNYTGIENVHKARMKTFAFYYKAVMYNYCGATEQMRACVSRYDESAWTCNDEARTDAHIASTGVRCISAHPSLPHQNTKRETSDASKSQVINQVEIGKFSNLPQKIN